MMVCDTERRSATQSGGLQRKEAVCDTSDLQNKEIVGDIEIWIATQSDGRRHMTMARDIERWTAKQRCREKVCDTEATQRNDPRHVGKARDTVRWSATHI